MSGNPLVASASSTPADPWSGVWIAEDIEQIHRGVVGGNWIDVTLGGVGAGLDGLAVVSDPVGTLLQYGVSWIIEHVRPLSRALDALAGDPSQIAAHAQTWRNIEATLADEATGLDRAVANDVGEWTGLAAEAYRARAGRLRTATGGLGSAAGTMATITEAAGMLVAGVRLMVRDAIAACVSKLIVYAAEEVASLGLATPLVVEQVTTTVAAWAARIGKWLRALLASLRRLEPIVRRLGELIEELKKILSRLREGSSGGRGASLLREGDGIVRNGKKILMSMDNLRAVAAKYGIDMRGVRVGLDRARSGLGPGKELYGMTLPNQKIVLTRDAFLSEEELARTLAHERFHLGELRSGLPFPVDPAARAAYEARAWEFERRWWDAHKHLLGE